MSSDRISAYLVPAEQTLVLEVLGKDAARVMNNLTTNEIANLAAGQACEAFVTDLRGWTVAHGIVFQQLDRVWLLGLHPDSSRVAAHIDRYIITEDAQVIDRSSEYGMLWSTGEVGLDPSTASNASSSTASSGAEEISSVQLPATAVAANMCFGPRHLVQKLVNSQLQPMSEEEWQLRRIVRFWPRMGEDIPEKCIPQEVDRTQSAISFTKGCYLGQETIARLDARGQLQKKLCLLRFEQLLDVGQPLPAKVIAARSESDRKETVDDGTAAKEIGGKEIGHVTSVARDEAERVSYALAYLRRGFFERGQRVECCGVSGRVV